MCQHSVKSLLLAIMLHCLCQWRYSAAAPMYVSHKLCNSVPVGTIVANPGNCRQYIQCNGLRSSLGDCPRDTYFNAKVLSCDKSRAACEAMKPAITTTTIAPTTTTTTATRTTTTTTTTAMPLLQSQPPAPITAAASIFTPAQLPQTSVVLAPAPTAVYASKYWRPVCTSWFDQWYPHPFNCEYFYHCVRGYLTIRRCAYAHGWDVQLRQCVPLRQARCYRSQVAIFNF